METTNDIFNEMRNWDYHSDLDLNAHEVLSQYADRFMDAHRREVEQYLKSLVECDKQIALLKKGHSNLEEIITKLKSELGEAAKWTRAELSRELAMNVEINNNLRIENSRLLNELDREIRRAMDEYTKLREDNERLKAALKPVLECPSCADFSAIKQATFCMNAVADAIRIYNGGVK